MRTLYKPNTKYHPMFPQAWAAFCSPVLGYKPRIKIKGGYHWIFGDVGRETGAASSGVINIWAEGER